MTSPKNRLQPKSNMDIEKHREEGNWQRCLELAQQDGSDHVHLKDFLTGEAMLEMFLEETAKKCFDLSKVKHHDDEEIDFDRLEKAKIHLNNCLGGKTDSPLMMDANLLLAKAYYISGQYHDALNYIRQSGINSIVNIDKSLPLRVIKLIAESFSVKAMSLEKISSRRSLKYIDQAYDIADRYRRKCVNLSKSITLEDNNNDDDDDDLDSYKTQIDCLTRVSHLAMRYVHNIEKRKGPYFTVNLGCIIDSALLRTHHIYIRNGHISDAVDYCRRMLNYCETASTLHIRQVLSKELAEILLKGQCRAVWRKPELNVSKQSQSQSPSYIGNSLFTPNEYEEEIVLLLMLSEGLASSNVLLERSPDFYQNRIQSLNKVLLIQDLFTISLIPLQCYYVDIYERAMKYSFEVKHVWYQFALTLMESKKSPLRSYLLLKEVARMDPVDPIPNLFAAKLCITELNKYEEAIGLVQDSLDRYRRLMEKKKFSVCSTDVHIVNGIIIGNDSSESPLINHIDEIYGEENLLHQIHLLLGITNALVYEHDTEASKKHRKNNLHQSIYHLNEAIKYDRVGNNYLPYFHIALHLAQQRALTEAVKYARVSLLLNPSHLPSIQLLILSLTGLKQYEEAYELCKNSLNEYSSQMILLYIKAHLEEIVCENGKELALLTAKEMLRCWRALYSDDTKKINKRTSYCSFIPSVSYDTMSLRMEQTLSEVISLESVPVHNSNTLNNNLNQVDSASQTERMYLSYASSVNGANGSLQEGKHYSWTFEMQIWLLVVELFLKLDQISEAESCVNDSAVPVFRFLSHQLMYIKGVISKKRGQFYDAKVQFQNAISINPKHAKALQQLGHTYYLLGNQISAHKYLKDSLNIDTTLHETWSYLGSVLDAIGEHERAAECHLTSIKLEETNPLLSFNIIPRCILD